MADGISKINLMSSAYEWRLRRGLFHAEEGGDGD